ncbi:hypothetical protein fs1p09 [Fibrovirus fs1]|uniref:Uncharacterized protein n=1 Tax=Fibrovirus fs1 TaxID=70203 RepID=O56842_9VIRU|nr:hypothetical protein fs1p09 [Fibrovirus fs1]BAA24169.1 hypothetical protein [Fibrovirus fs1]
MYCINQNWLLISNQIWLFRI